MDTVNEPSGGSGRTGEAGIASARTTSGLRLERIYTRPGVHPYDEVTWERRDIVLTNWRDGSGNFEQRGVEFPAFWSDISPRIVPTKDFPRAPGPAQRHS